ncbi:MAG: hypothetical protein LBT22_04090 [Peptococcaceae bacterium]|jgi:hypothetical protein|nr:hypothetical protein [Peptococcaceae bacterium]
MLISEQFDVLLENLRLENLDNLAEKFKTITKQLNTDFRNYPSDSAYSKLVGPVGRGTAIKTTHTVEMYIRLPGSLYDKYQTLENNNGQLQMLKDVQASVLNAYPAVDATIQENLVSVPFPEMIFQITPIVQLDSGDYVCPDPSQNGSWRQPTQLLEVEAINQANQAYKRKVKDLARIAHVWRETWQVPLSPILLDALILHFLDSGAYNDALPFHHSMADFLNYLAQQDPSRQSWPAMGSQAPLQRTGSFEAPTRESWVIAQKALDAEAAGKLEEAAAAWKKIFGPYYPD